MDIGALILAVNLRSASVDPPTSVIGPPPIACGEVFHGLPHFDSTGGFWVLGKYLDEIRRPATLPSPMPFW